MRDIKNLMAGLTVGAALMVSQAVAVEGVIEAPAQTADTFGTLDYANAIPMDKRVDFNSMERKSTSEVPSVEIGEPGVVSGNRGTGEMLHESLGKPVKAVKGQTDVQPAEFGTSNRPFATSRVDMYDQRLSRKYPNRVTGKLFFKIGSATYVCSASSIKPGVVVTAAHCIYDNENDVYYSGWEFIPAYYKDSTVGEKAPFGRYGYKTAYVMDGYINPPEGDNVVNNYDVGVIVMKKRTNPNTGTDMFPGERTGWYGYGYNGWGYTDGLNDGSLTLIHQLGYPVSHDNGWQMQANDSQGEKTTQFGAMAIMIGSRETGGSSGGPWLVNYGEIASLSGTTAGTYPTNDVVVAVTSWGWTSSDPKEQGATPFTDGNIVPLLDTVCTNYPTNCGL
ncbi:trypsin-like serine peptidase [Sulfurovum lithotrophicum]|uniref:trypsin-like serine peptidase n=1 Tax=Sulfurovum lithotrophicum TaxID=206403 RepID=UPI000695EE28|nr:trypsin-like serine protease [Sulfurovum lithotrophicum]